MTAKYPEHLYPGCPCFSCDSPTWPTETIGFTRMSICPMCGDKRCPGAHHHAKHRVEGVIYCRHCGMPIERDTIGWHHTENKRIVCQLVTTAEPEDTP
ncbi:hypothetical protein [Prescottella equi]|uniref:hypothetical protein n=1 Tax=Rhodococcus hoagii TaxID=43767 RepID=UPI001EEC806A|nr:hypothetical protein [Prescottella equi]